MNRDRLLLYLYLAGILAATLVHDPVWLCAGLVLVLLLAGGDAWRLLRRALLAILAFNTLISLSYALMAWWQDISPWLTLARLNLRVLLLTSLTFLFIARANLFRALDFSKGLTYVLGLAYSQALTFRRAHEDFRLALASRSLRRPRLMDRYRASAAAASWFLEKSLHAATQSAQALRSRGFFHD
ncbi:MAG: ABC transporter permease [Thiobacillaceae bacterium]|nr:ABC transporter permease [Thiobacillaceae bacterium]